MNRKGYKHLDTITALFVAVLIISNIGSTKIVDFGLISLDGGVVLFPLSYIFGDILTEVYGYKRSRKVIWLGFGSALLMTFSLSLIGLLPSDPNWAFQEDYNNILGMTPRIVLGSLVAYFGGEFSNSYILAKMKIFTKGKKLWTRTIGSTLVGQVVDTSIFVIVAFYGVFDNDLIWHLIWANYVFKTGVEIIFTPITYRAVSWLKKEENEDYYDRDTEFNPFHFND